MNKILQINGIFGLKEKLISWRKDSDELYFQLQDFDLEILELIDKIGFKKKVFFATDIFNEFENAKELLNFNFEVVLPYSKNIELSVLNLIANSQKASVHLVVNDKEGLKVIKKVKRYFITVKGDLEELFLDIKEFSKDKDVFFLNYQRELFILLNKPFAGPIVVQFEITNKCNHQCIFCYHHSPHLLNEDDDYFKRNKFDKDLCKRTKEWHSSKIEFDVIKKYIKELSKMDCSYIQLGGGGEPFTHPDMFKILKLIKKYNFTVQVFTNLTMLSKEKLRKISEIGVDILEINLSGVTAKTYSKIHSCSEKVFYDLVESMKYLAKLGKTKFRIMNPICSLNYSEIPEMVKFGKEVGAEAVYLGHLQTTPQTKYLDLNEKQRNEVKKFVKKLDHDIENNFDYFLQVLDMNERKGSHTKELFDKVGCLISFYEAQIHMDGTIAPCCLHPPIFKIDNRSFKEIWGSIEYKDYREKVLELYKHKEKKMLCRGCEMCVYQKDIERFYNNLGKLVKFL